MDPDPGGPKTFGFCGSGSPTLVVDTDFFCFIFCRIIKISVNNRKILVQYCEEVRLLQISVKTVMFAQDKRDCVRSVISSKQCDGPGLYQDSTGSVIRIQGPRKRKENLKNFDVLKSSLDEWRLLLELVSPFRDSMIHNLFYRKFVKFS
jgi:hypothetical protein